MSDPVITPAAEDAAASSTASPTPCSNCGQRQGSVPLSRALSGDGDRAGPSPLTLEDMELLHHYTISTSLTLSSDLVVRNYFQVSVPPLAFSHVYVLHCILALAASHLAHFRPETRRYYYAYARAQHTTATSMAAPLLSNISETNQIPMYFFSILTLFIAFGSLRDEDDLYDDASGFLPNWLALFRGVRTVLESNNRSIYSSSVSHLFYSSEVNRIWQTKLADIEALIEFQDYLEASTSEDEETRQVLLNTFQELRRALYFFYGEERGNEDRTRSLFTWMYRVPDEFHSLLRSGNYKALCILAFFCVLLHRLEHNWWFHGWGVHLIDRIYTALDEVHRFWIHWPIQQIGWIPKRDPKHLSYHTTPPNT